VNHFTSYGFFIPPPAVVLPPAPLADPGSAPDGGGGAGPGPGPDSEHRGCNLSSDLDVTTGNRHLDVNLKYLPSYGLESKPALAYNSKSRRRHIPFFMPIKIDDAAQYRKITKINWEFTIAGRSFTGDTFAVDVDWDMRDSRGLPVEPGVYQATLNTTSFTFEGNLITGKQNIPVHVQGPGARYGLGWNLNEDMRLIVNRSGKSNSSYWLHLPSPDYSPDHRCALAGRPGGRRRMRIA
jgi:hypothetical protein